MEKSNLGRCFVSHPSVDGSQKAPEIFSTTKGVRLRMLTVRHSVYIPFNGRKRTEMGISAKGGLTNKILGYIATGPPYGGTAT